MYKPGTYTAEQIRFAVYKAAGARDWQRFRVALKGLPTGLKLGALLTRLVRIAAGEEWFKLENTLERIRIDNYIGALRRGGQLDENFRVVK